MARFHFTVEDDSDLDSLVRMTGRWSRADVVRDAIAVYHMLAERVEGGERIFIGNTKDGSAELTITSLRSAAPGVVRRGRLR